VVQSSRHRFYEVVKFDSLGQITNNLVIPAQAGNQLYNIRLC
jgi:hypothetical protein